MLVRVQCSRVACVLVKRRHATTVPSLSLSAFDINAGRLLGKGKHGMVYWGQHRESGHEVAIKLAAAHAELDLEKHAFKKLLVNGEKHPHVVEVFQEFPTSVAEIGDVGIKLPIEVRDGSVHCFVMSYLGGGSLKAAIKQRRLDQQLRQLMTDNLDVAMVDPTCTTLQLFDDHETMEVARCLGKALRFLHGRNIIHRDVKPLNLLFRDSNQDLAKLALIDFSVAGVAPRSASEYCLNLRVGTRGFTAPEVLQMKFESQDRTNENAYGYTSACDIFSAGCTLHSMITGEPPTVTLKPGIPAEVTTNLPQCTSGALRSMIDAMLASRPSDRPTVHDVLKLCSE